MDCLPQTFKPHAGKFITAAAMAIARDWQLQRCTKESILQCTFDAARFGLTVNDIRGHAYLIPFRNKKGDSVCTLLIGYKGFVELARRSGFFTTIETKTVGPCDQFKVSYETEGTKFLHVPNFNEPYGDAEINYVYAMIRQKGSETWPLIEIMSRIQVEHVRATSKCGNVWASHWGEMARKSVLRRLLKMQAISDEMAQAMEYDDNQHTQGPIVTPSDEKGTKSLADRLESRAQISARPAEEEAESIDSPEPDAIDVEVEEPPLESPAPPPPPPAKAKQAKPKDAPAPPPKKDPEPPPAEDDLVADAADDEGWDLNRE